MNTFRLFILVCILAAESKATSQPSVVWSDMYTNPAVSTAEVIGIRVVSTNFVYAWGEANTTNGDRDIQIVAYQQDGTFLWSALLDGGAQADDHPVDLLPSPAGGLCVAGTLTASGSITSYGVIRLSANASELWRCVVPNLTNLSETVTSACIDDEGRVYLTGSALGTNGYTGMRTVCVNTNGVVLWSDEYWTHHPQGDRDAAGTAITTDQQGHIYVGGVTYIPNAPGPYHILAKYPTEGPRSWLVTRVYSGGNRAAFVRAEGTNVFLSTNDRMFGYSTNGVELWVSPAYVAAFPWLSSVIGMMIDTEGRPYVARTADMGKKRYSLVKIGYDGTALLNDYLESNPYAGNQYLQDACMDQYDNVYLAGSDGTWRVGPDGRSWWRLAPIGSEASVAVNDSGDLFIGRMPFITECYRPSRDDDLDRDGIPNGWEEDHFYHVTGAAAGEDTDLDSLSNWQEYIAGTDPTNPLSIQPPLKWTGTSLLIETSSLERCYFIVSTSNLLGAAWTDETNQMGTGAALLFDPQDAGPLKSFKYDIRLP